MDQYELLAWVNVYSDLTFSWHLDKKTADTDARIQRSLLNLSRLSCAKVFIPIGQFDTED